MGDCKRCELTLGNASRFLCVACDARFHWTTECTGFDKILLNSMNKVRNNFLMVCNECNDNGKRDAILSDIITSRENSKMNQLLATVEKSVTEIGQRVKSNTEEITQRQTEIISKVSAVHPRPEINANTNNQYDETHQYSLRIDGVSELTGPEDEKPTVLNLLEADRRAVNDIFNQLTEDPGIMDIKRLGRFDKDRQRPRTILVTLKNIWDVRKIVAKSSSIRSYDKKVYISKALSKSEIEIENSLLKKRRELINSGVEAKDLYIKGLKLFRGKVQVEMQQS